MKWAELSTKQQDEIGRKLLAALASLSIGDVSLRWLPPDSLPHWQLIAETTWCANKSQDTVREAREKAIGRAAIDPPMGGVILKSR